MTEVYTVLLDMSRTPTSEPFRAGIERLDVDAGPVAPRIDRAELSKKEVLDLSRAPEVRAVAPVMPTTLVMPVADADAGLDVADDPAPGGVAWGVTAVGADTSDRDGSGITAAI